MPISSHNHAEEGRILACLDHSRQGGRPAAAWRETTMKILSINQRHYCSEKSLQTLSKPLTSPSQSSSAVATAAYSEPKLLLQRLTTIQRRRPLATLMDRSRSVINSSWAICHGPTSLARTDENERTFFSHTQRHQSNSNSHVAFDFGGVDGSSAFTMSYGL